MILLHYYLLLYIRISSVYKLKFDYDACLEQQLASLGWSVTKGIMLRFTVQYCLLNANTVAVPKKTKTTDKFSKQTEKVNFS